MKTVAELNAARAAALKKVVLRKGNEVLSKEVKSDYKYTVLVCGGTGCTSSHSHDIVDKLHEEVNSNGIRSDHYDRLLRSLRSRTHYDRISRGLLLFHG